MKFNDGAYPKCSKAQAVPGALKAGACKSSIIGRGSTIVDARGTTLGILNADLTAYNAERGLFILLRVKQNPALDQVLRAKLTRSNTLVTVLDDSLRGIRAELTNFRLVINPQAGRLKGKKTPYAVLPKKCPKSGKFIIRTKYYFQDYVTQKRTGTSTTSGTVNKCRK